MKEKKDNIYIYLWENFNTIYIGRTINPKSRHYQHKHRESEKTYQFSSEHHVEHPKMVIIENDLSVEEGIEREKYWIDYYKHNTSYSILNKTRGGQVGNLSDLTDEERRENQKKYYQNNRKNKITYQKVYNENHKDKINKYRKEHKEEISQNKKKYYKENLEKIVLYRETHKEEKRKYKKEYDKLNKEKRREYYLNNKEKIREYQNKNKEKIQIYQKNYRETHKKS